MRCEARPRQQGEAGLEPDESRHMPDKSSAQVATTAQHSPSLSVSIVAAILNVRAVLGSSYRYSCEGN